MINKLRVIILAAGKGTRMKSPLPKVLHNIMGKPMLMCVIESVLGLSPEKIYVIVGYKPNLVKNIIRKRMKNISDKLDFVKQERLIGTADAVRTVLPYIKSFNGQIVILCGDIPLIRSGTLKKMIHFHCISGNELTLLTADLDNPYGYGRIIHKPGTNDIIEIKEELDLAESEKSIKEINTGIYCINNKILINSIKKVKKNLRKGEYYLTDIVKIISRQNKKVRAIKVSNVDEIVGINTRQELERVIRKYHKNLEIQTKIK